MLPCPTSTELLHCANGDLPEREAAGILEHVENCARCQVEMDRLLQDSEALFKPGLPPDQAGLSVYSTQSSSSKSGFPPIPGYDILTRCGRRGLGVVYHARHLRTQREVALKVVELGPTATAELVLRFRVEAERSARLRHPHVVAVYEVGEWQGQPYLALEWVEAATLARVLRTGPLPPAEAAQLVARLADAIQLAHQHGIFHRDLKPGNVLIAASSPKIADFGLSALLGSPGTPEYLAPEQVAAQDHGLGASVDVYALGLLLYEALAGQPPFRGTTAYAVTRLVLEQPPPALRDMQPQLPLDLETICLKCLQKKPQERYGSAAEVADDLNLFLRGEPIAARRQSELERVRRWARRRPAVVALVLTLLAALLMSIAAAGYFVQQAESAVKEAHAQEEAARGASDEANALARRSQQDIADLLYARGQQRAAEGELAEGLLWLAASLRRSTNPEFEDLVRRQIAALAARVPVLVQWLPTAHESAALAPDGRTLATIGREGDAATIHLWDWRNGVALAEGIATGDAECLEPRFSPDGQTLLTVSNPAHTTPGKPGWARLWDVSARRARTERLLHGGTANVTFWDPHGKFFLTADDKQIYRWHGTTGRFLQVLRAGSTRAPGRNVWISPDGTLAAVVHGAAPQNAITILDLTTDREVAPPIKVNLSAVRSVQFSADRASCWIVGVAMGVPTAYRCELDPSSGKPLTAPMSVTLAHPELAALLDGRLITIPSGSLSPDERYHLRVQDGVQIRRLPRDWSRSPADVTTIGQNRSTAPVVVYAADGKRAATYIAEEWVRVFDASTGQTFGRLLHCQAHTQLLALSPDGTRVAFTEPLGTIAVYDVDTGKPCGPNLLCSAEPRALAFTTAGQQLAVATTTNDIFFYDTTTGQPVGNPLRQTEVITTLAWHPDNTRLVVAGARGSFRVWDVVNRQPLRAVTPVRACRHSCFAFSPDGTLLVAGHDNGEAQVWRLDSMQPLGASVQQATAITRVEFTERSRSFATSDAAGNVRTWPVVEPISGSPDALERAVQLSTGLRLNGVNQVLPLTRAEWTAQRSDWLAAGKGESWDGGLVLTDPDWHSTRAAEAEQAERWFTARWHLNQLLQNGAGEWQLHARLANAWVRQDRFPEAESALQRARKEAPPAAFERWLRTEAERTGASDPRAARWYLDMLVKAHPEEGTLLWQRGKFAADQAEQTRALELGIDAALHWQAVWDSLQGGRWDEAQARLARLKPEAIDELSRAEVEALICLRRQDEAGYKAVCGRILARLPATNDKVDLAWLCRWVAVLTLGPEGCSQWDVTLQLCESTLKNKALSGPERQALLSARGAVLYRSGKYGAARQALQEAIELDPRRADGAMPALVALAATAENQSEVAKQWQARAQKEDARGMARLRQAWLLTEVAARLK